MKLDDEQEVLSRVIELLVQYIPDNWDSQGGIRNQSQLTGVPVKWGS